MNTDIRKLNRKEVVIFCQYAQQPPYNTMLRYHNWGKELISRGYYVSIVAASVVHNTSIDVIEKLNKNDDIVDGVHYYYVKTSSYSSNGIKRMLNMYEYCKGLSKYKRVFNPDYLIVCGAYVYLFSRKLFKKTKIITDIVDLWPLSIVEYANKSEKSLLIRLLYRVEKHAYKKTDALIFSMEGGIDYVKEQKYSKRVDLNKVFHINMGCDLVEVDKCKELYHSQLPWDPQEFNIGYCGSIRKANNVKQICEAANTLLKRGYNNIKFQIYGNGDELDELQEYCSLNSINNVRFYGRIEKNKIPYILSNTKANILTYKQVGLMKYGGSQSKLFDYLASGNPIICNAHFGYNLITRYSCGLVTETQDSDSFANTVEELYNMSKEDLFQMGLNARKTAEDYTQPILVDKLEKIFNYLETKT